MKAAAIRGSQNLTAPTIALQGGPQGGMLVWLDKWASLAANDVGGLMLYPPGP